jgi:signal transduction histidine kinase
LAAGLAHEHNNPAAAAVRAATQLHHIFKILPSVNLGLQSKMTAKQLEFVSKLEQNLANEHAKSSILDSLIQSDREDQITSWLDGHGISDGWKLAQILAATGLDTQHLDNIAKEIPSESLQDALSWLDVEFSAKNLLDEIYKCIVRISELVKAIKIYSYIDQAAIQDIDIHQGIESTLIILNHKLREGEGKIIITRDYDLTLSRISAYGSELNQVWTNLISNSIDAAKEEGHKNQKKRLQYMGAY